LCGYYVYSVFLFVYIIYGEKGNFDNFNTGIGIKGIKGIEIEHGMKQEVKRLIGNNRRRGFNHEVIQK